MTRQKALMEFQRRYFGEISDRMTQLLEPVSVRKALDRRDVLFWEGDPGTHIWFLLQGDLKLFRTTAAGQETIVHFVHAGEMFAEILLSRDQQGYPVSCMALEDCDLLGIDAAQLRAQIERHPELALDWIANLGRRLRHFVNQVEQLTTGDVRTRFLHYLEHLCEQQHSQWVQLPVPKGELAIMLGTTPETFSRMLRRLSQEGVLQVQGRRIRLCADVEEGE